MLALYGIADCLLHFGSGFRMHLFEWMFVKSMIKEEMFNYLDIKTGI